MLAAMLLMSALGSWRGSFTPRDGVLLLGLYPLFVVLVLLT